MKFAESLRWLFQLSIVVLVICFQMQAHAQSCEDATSEKPIPLTGIIEEDGDLVSSLSYPLEIPYDDPPPISNVSVLNVVRHDICSDHASDASALFSQTELETMCADANPGLTCTPGDVSLASPTPGTEHAIVTVTLSINSDGTGTFYNCPFIVNCSGGSSGGSGPAGGGTTGGPGGGGGTTGNPTGSGGGSGGGMTLDYYAGDIFLFTIYKVEDGEVVIDNSELWHWILKNQIQ